MLRRGDTSAAKATNNGVYDMVDMQSQLITVENQSKGLSPTDLFNPSGR